MSACRTSVIPVIGTNVSYILDMGDGTVYEFFYPYEDDCAANDSTNCTFTVQSWNFTSNGTGNGTVYGTTNGK